MPRPKGKIVDALPAKLKGRLKGKLVDMTFSELFTVGAVLEKFHDMDPQGFHQRACGDCQKWGT